MNCEECSYLLHLHHRMVFTSLSSFYLEFRLAILLSKVIFSGIKNLCYDERHFMPNEYIANRLETIETYIDLVEKFMIFSYQNQSYKNLYFNCKLVLFSDDKENVICNVLEKNEL